MASDRDLHDAFAVLRREAGAAAPEFRETLVRLARRRERHRRRRRRVAALAGAAIGLALISVAWPLAHRNRVALVNLTATHWDAPTDFLLRTPGAELLRRMPMLTTDGRITP